MKQSWTPAEVEAALELVRVYGADGFARHAKATSPDSH